MARREQEPAQAEQAEPTLSAEEKQRLLELLQDEMSTEEVAAALSHRRGVTVPKWEVERAIAQLKAEADKADAAQLDSLFADQPDLETEIAADQEAPEE